MNRQQDVAHVVALVAIGVCVLASPALAQGWPELVGRWPYGPTYAVAVSGNHAYFGSGAVLMVADISVPSAPQLVGEVALRGVAEGITVVGSHAYIAAENAGLLVIDVSTPTAPVEVGFLDTPDCARKVAVSGDYAYVAWADDWYPQGGLRVIDVSEPTGPVEVGFADTPGQFARDVAVSGSYAYVVVVSGELRVIDVSTPSAPVEVGLIDRLGTAFGVALSGSFAYVAARESGLRVIDVSTPSAPVVVGSAPGYAYDVAVSGSYAYIASYGGFQVIDVSTPSAPVEVGFLDTPDRAIDVAVSGSYAYAADEEEGLRVIDVSTPSAPVEVGSVGIPWIGANDLAISADHAYVRDKEGFLRVIDVSIPSAPVVQGFVYSGGSDLAVSGGYAYLASGPEGLVVIDVSNPSAPVEVGHLDTPGWAFYVAVAGGHAYVADYRVLRVIDVSNPSAPVEVAHLDMPDGGWGVAISGRYAYVAARGLRVIDVSTPSAPIEVGSVDAPLDGWKPAVSGGYAYVMDHGSVFRVIDVSTPSAPVEAGFVNVPPTHFPPGSGGGVAVSGRFVYVADGDGDLRLIDVGTPSAPVEVGFVDTPGFAWDVAISNGYVYVTLSDAGLSIFRDWGGSSSFIPAAAVAAGAEGAFFQTDLEINNTGTEEAQLYLDWLPRGEDNSQPLSSDLYTLTAGKSLRFENVVTELFGLGPDSVGALELLASTESVIGMSRTYNIPAGGTTGTFGQGLPAIRTTEMIAGTEPHRIIFLSEDAESRANVGCVNGSSEAVRINIGVFNAEGTLLETKTMDLGPYSNNQINRIFRNYQPVNGYVDVWANRDDALYYCYGSMLDNLTSDPTTILPQVPSDDMTFIPAAALAAGLEGAFFQTDVDLNNVGSTDITYELLWLPRAIDNSDPVRSNTFSLAPGAAVRYANALDEIFGLEPDRVGALAVEASGTDLLAMSRTYNLLEEGNPLGYPAGATFGQELPGIPADRMIASGVKKRIIFMNENDDVRSNVGCQNGTDQTVRVFIELFSAEGESLETKTMDLQPYSNNQVTRVFRNHSPISAGYVDVWTATPGATIYCYGSVLDNLTSDPTTVLPQ